MRKKYLLILVLLSGLLFFFKLGSFSLYDAAETTYGEFVKNILNTGDWITLHYNGQIIFDKPPLYYWLAALLSKIIGFNEWAMRCWAALAGILTVVTTYRLGKVLYNERTGFLSGIIVMTAFQFLIQSRIAELDIVLTLFIYLAIFCFYCGYISNQRKYYLLAYFPMALAILIKGLLGVALPALAIFLFLLFKKELGKIKDFYPVWGGVIIALIGLPWYVIEYLRHGRVFLDFALGFLFLSRFQGVVSGHTGPWYYYLPALLLGFAPWSHFLPYSLWNTFKHWKKDPELLISCFIIPAFIVFSAAKTKLPNYVLPLYPFLAITAGKLWDDFLADERRFIYGLRISNLFFLLVVALIIFGFVIVGNSNYPAQYQIFIPGLLLLAAILAGGSLISIILFFLRAYAASFYSIPAMVFLIVLVLTLQVLPQVELFKGAKPLGAEIRTVIRPGESIAVYDVGNRPSVVLHSPRPVIFLDSDSALASFLNKKRGYAFTTVNKYEKIKKMLPKTVTILDIKGDLLVVYNR
jgi:4-amino-4-deoxy-L-arabinose transferase-like glycosyltransferase